MASEENNPVIFMNKACEFTTFQETNYRFKWLKCFQNFFKTMFISEF